jgi:hypothetical protein
MGTTYYCNGSPRDGVDRLRPVSDDSFLSVCRLASTKSGFQVVREEPQPDGINPLVEEVVDVIREIL